MNFDRAFGYTQFPSDYLIGKSVADQYNDLLLAIGQHGHVFPH
jgi:hypothetical protein